MALETRPLVDRLQYLLVKINEMAFNVQFTKGIKNMLCSQFKTKKPELHNSHFGSQ